MTQIFSDGFESGDFSQWTATENSTGETTTVVTTDPHHGSYHMKASCNGSSAGEYARAYRAITSSSVVYARAYFKFKTAFPASTKEFGFLELMNSSAAWIFYADVYNDAGTVKWRMHVYESGVGVTYTATTGPSLDTWYCVELYGKVSATAGEAKLYIDGTEILSTSGKDTDNRGNVTRVYAGEVYSNGQTVHDIYVDCVIVADAYIGPEGGGQLYEIFADAIAKSLDSVSEECTFNIAEDATVKSQADKFPEATFTISLDSIIKALAAANFELSLQVEAVIKALADVAVEKIGGAVYEIFNDAISTGQATFTVESTLNINKDATQLATAIANIESIFNLSPEAVVKVLGQVEVLKEGEIKVTRLFLVLGNVAIQIQGI